MNANPATSEAAAPAPNSAATSELRKLIADIEEVLTRAGHSSDVDVADLREGLRLKLAMATAGLTAGGRRIGQAARTAAAATDDYVHRSPWPAIGIAAAAGTSLGFLLGKR